MMGEEIGGIWLNCLSNLQMRTIPVEFLVNLFQSAADSPGLFCIKKGVDIFLKIYIVYLQ